MTDVKNNFVIGLCNDELGYIIPENDFILNDETPYINAAKDRFDRRHYEETNSVGPKVAENLLNNISQIIKEQP
jgi:hypothetical protein